MMWLSEERHAASRSPDTISTSTLLNPASEAFSWAGSRTWVSSRDATETATGLTVVNAYVEGRSYCEGQQRVIAQARLDEAAQCFSFDHPRAVLVCFHQLPTTQALYVECCIPQSAQALPTRRRACLLRGCCNVAAGTAERTESNSPESPSGVLHDAEDKETSRTISSLNRQRQINSSAQLTVPCCIGQFLNYPGKIVDDLDLKRGMYFLQPGGPLACVAISAAEKLGHLVRSPGHGIWTAMGPDVF